MLILENFNVPKMCPVCVVFVQLKIVQIKMIEF